MARKKQKQKQKYTKDEFADIVCPKCALCVEDRPNFCYVMYKKNTARFFEYSYPKLIKAAYWPHSKNKSKRLFKKIFCGSGICGKKRKKGKRCQDLNSCMINFYPAALAFVQAGRGIDTDVTKVLGFVGKSKLRKKKRKKSKFIAAAYPTFFCSDNEEWKKEIREALYGEDKNEEQAGNSKSTSELKGGSDTGTDTS